MRRMTFAAIAVTAVAFSLAACAGGATSPAQGIWIAEAPAAGEAPSLTLASDGKVSGTDGCNRIVGSWTAEGSAVEFSELATTMMACEGVDDWLNAAVTGTVDGNTLTVYDKGDNAIGELQRAAN